jgi:predicted nucleotidyltransferase
MPVFRSSVQAEILAELLLHPGEERTLTELATRAGAALPTVHGEVARLVAAGILSQRTVGRSRLLRADTANPAVRPLTDLLALTYGPLPVVAEAFGEVAGVEEVWLYGSWAARYRGEPGPPPHDIDVLVVGTADRTAVYDAADIAEAALGRPVHPVLVTRERYDAAAEPLLREIASAPRVRAVPPEASG